MVEEAKGLIRIRRLLFNQARVNSEVKKETRRKFACDFRFVFNPRILESLNPSPISFDIIDKQPVALRGSAAIHLSWWCILTNLSIQQAARVEKLKAHLSSMLSALNAW